MSHYMMCRVPKMDNASGRMLETGPIEGNSAPFLPRQDGRTTVAEGRFLAHAAVHRGTMMAQQQEQGARGKA